MRGIFITLLLINGIYFGYSALFSGKKDEHSSRGVGVNQGQALYSDTESIVLLKEYTKVQEQQALASKLDDQMSSLGLSNTKKQHPSAGYAASFCPVIGPFDSKPLLLEFLQAWGRKKSEITVTTLEKLESTQYWLHSEPYENIELALAEVARIQREGYDAYLQKANNGEHRVVVGGYLSDSEVRLVEERLKGIGLSVNLVEKNRERSEFWIKINTQESVTEVKRDLGDVLEQFNDILLSQSVCE